MAADAGWDIRVVARKFWGIKINNPLRRRVMGDECYDQHVNVICRTVHLNLNRILAPSNMFRLIWIYGRS